MLGIIIIVIFKKRGPVTVKTENGNSVIIAGARNQDRGGSSADDGKPSDSRVKAGERTTSASVSDKATVREPSTAGRGTRCGQIFRKATTTPTPVPPLPPHSRGWRRPTRRFTSTSIGMKLAALAGRRIHDEARRTTISRSPIRSRKPQHQVGLSRFLHGGLRGNAGTIQGCDG